LLVARASHSQEFRLGPVHLLFEELSGREWHPVLSKDLGGRSSREDRSWAVVVEVFDGGFESSGKGECGLVLAEGSVVGPKVTEGAFPLAIVLGIVSRSSEVDDLVLVEEGADFCAVEDLSAVVLEDEGSAESPVTVANSCPGRE
jgi:hypothetical protein